MTSRTGLTRTGFSRWWGAVCGLLTAAAAMGIGQLFAGFAIPAASPVVAVGEAAIDRTPLAVKDWATSTFGTDDKTVLLAGVLIVVFLYSMLVGVLAMRRLALGFIGLAIFAGLGLAAALTRPDATASYAVPTIFGAIAGAIVLSWLVVTARRAALAGQEAGPARPPPAADRLPPIAFGPGRSGAGDGGRDRSPETAGHDGPAGAGLAGDSGRRADVPGRDDDSGWGESSGWGDDPDKADAADDSSGGGAAGGPPAGPDAGGGAPGSGAAGGD